MTAIMCICLVLTAGAIVHASIREYDARYWKNKYEDLKYYYENDEVTNMTSNTHNSPSEARRPTITLFCKSTWGHG